MRKIELMEDGYEIVITIPDKDTTSDSSIIEADAYYKDFDEYRILILADSEEKAVEIAKRELLTNHPFEQVVREY